MPRLFYQVMQDNVGNLLFGVSGTMRLAGTGTLATIYGDEAMTVILPNPMTNHPSFGSFKCFLGAGDYDFYMAKSGYSFETLTGVQGHGTMAQQDAGAVAVTGGTAVLTRAAIGQGLDLTQALAVTGNSFLSGPLGISTPSTAGYTMMLAFPRNVLSGIGLRPSDNDVGGGQPLILQNQAGTIIGAIQTSASATLYATTSDARLKTAIEPLTGALDVVRALKPSRFRWKADDSAGVGFLAGEVQEVIPDGVITGERGAIDSEGNILPQQMDLSKLVPWLVGAVQTLAGQVEILTERVAELETGLGV